MVSWSVSYAGIQQLLEEDNSKYHDSDVGSNIGILAISIPDLRLGDKEQHVVKSSRSTQACSPMPLQVSTNSKLGNIIGSESDVEREEDEDNMPNLIADSQEEQFSPPTSTDKAVSQMLGKNKGGCGGIF